MHQNTNACQAIDHPSGVQNALSKIAKIAIGTALMALTASANAATPGSILINEFMASNSAGYTDESGAFEDWVELYNPTSNAINVGGMHFTDDLGDPNLWQIPTTDASATTIPAGGYLVFWFDKDIADGILHVNAKLGSSGEDIGLFDVDGVTAIDTYTYGQQTTDVSEGRESDAASNFVFFTNPNPGATNLYTSAGFADAPSFDQDGCYVNSPFTVNLSSGTSGAVIRYTTDGSVPDTSSPVASGSLNLTGPTAVRARAYAPGFEPSATTTRTFLVDVSHDFALLSVTTDDNLLNGPNGIFTLFTENIDVVANIELYEPDCSLAFNQLAEIEVQGGSSQSYPQKSLSIKAKTSLGNTYFDHPIWPETGFTRHKSFVARNSGQDHEQTKFRDAYLQSLVDDSADVEDRILPLQQDGQAARPAITYINGQYYGIHNLRERIDWRYIEAYYGVAQDEYTYVNRRWATIGGSQRNDELFDFIQNNNLAIDSNFEYMRYIIDIDNYIDYMIFEMYIDNGDWPRNNLKYWREIADGGQWRWFVFDTDWSTRDPATRTFARFLDLSLAGTDHNEEWSTELFREMMKNPGFRAEFMNRLADQMNVVWDSNRTEARLFDYITTYANERQIHADFWTNGVNPTTIWTGRMSNFFQNRAINMYNDAVAEVPGVTGIAAATLDVSPAGSGRIQFNTTFPTAANLPFNGKWFAGLPIPIKARPAPGQVFTGWSDSSIPQTEDSVITLSGNAWLTANFGPGSTATDGIVINEINYKSPDAPDPGDWVELHNPTSNAVDISGWMLGDEGGGIYSIPANTVLSPGGYLVVAEDLNLFKSEYPALPNVVGSFGDGPTSFGLSGGGEEITLTNAPGVTIDVVDYDDNAPWPTSPDGDGDTAQLNSATANNNDGANWAGAIPTPGCSNSNCGSGGGTNSQPDLVNPGSTSTSCNAPVSVQLTATDADNDALTWTAQNLLTGLSINQNGLITGTIPTPSGGNVTVQVSDGISSPAAVTFYWGAFSCSSGGGSSSSSSSSSGSGSSGSGSNLAPTLAYPGTQTSQCDTPISLQLNASDPNGDALTWTAQNLPQGLSISQTGLISGIVPQRQGANVTVQVGDGSLMSGPIMFYWGIHTCASPGSSSTSSGSSTSSSSSSSTSSGSSSTGSSGSGSGGTNQRPSVTNPGTQDSQCNTSISLQLSASDPEGDPITWSAFNLPTGLSINGNGLITGVVPERGGYNVTIIANDGQSDSGDMKFYWGLHSCAAPGSSTSSSSSTGGSTGSSSSSGSTGSSTSGSSSGGSGTNTKPYLMNVGSQETLCNVPVSLQLSYVDPDGDPVSWTASNLHPGLWINQNGLISGTISQPGGKRITVIINDGSLDSNPRNFWWSAYSCAP